MRFTDITEKKSTYWRTSEKKPKLSKPSKKHQQRHPGQSRGMVGDSVEFNDKPIKEKQKDLRRADNKLDSLPNYVKRAAGGAVSGALSGAGIGAALGAISPDAGLSRWDGAISQAKSFGKTGGIIGGVSPIIQDLLSPQGEWDGVKNEPQPLKASDTIPNHVEDEYHRLAKVNKVFAQLFINAYHKTNDIDKAYAVAKKQYEQIEPKIESVQKKLDEAYSGSKSALVSAVMSDLEKKAMDGDADDVKFLRRLASLIGKKIIKRDNGSLMLQEKIPFNKCPKCGDAIFHESEGKKDACYHKVKSRYKVWPSAYASGALVKCRKVGAKNWGNKSKK